MYVSACALVPPPPRSTASAYIRYASARRNIGKSTSAKPVLDPGAPVDVTLRYFGAGRPFVNSVRLGIVTVCPSVHRTPDRRSIVPLGLGNSATNSGRARSPHQPPSSPKLVAFILPPTDACVRNV